MRRGLLVLLAPFLFSAALVAQSQVSGGIVAGGQVFFSEAKPEAVVARVSPEEVVSRLLTFDRDRDGKVAESELAERMQPLMARGDSNRDGALDPAEIRALAVAPSPQVLHQGRIGGPFGGSYGFADEDSFSSRNHIEGAIEDLKLAAGARDEALAVAKSYVDKVEADAGVDLVNELKGVLTPDQILALQASLQTRQKAFFRVRTDDGATREFVVSSAAPVQLHINQLRLTGDKRVLAQQAADRYMARVKMSEAARVALVDEMKGILSSEERDDLRAALVRRPVVATGGLAGVRGLQGNLRIVVDELTVAAGKAAPSLSIAIEER